MIERLGLSSPIDPWVLEYRVEEEANIEGGDEYEKEDDNDNDIKNEKKEGDEEGEDAHDEDF